MLLGEDNGGVNQSADNAVTERQRTVLGKISKSSAAGSLRHTRVGPGHVNSLCSDSRTNAKISVYQENENNDVHISVQSNKIGTFANRDEVYKENLKKPQQWNKGFSKKQLRTTAPPIPAVTNTPTFQVLKDEDWDDNTDKNEAAHLQQPTPVTASKVLKIRKAEVGQKTPMQLFESSHIGISRNNMPKVEVFSGGREYSFEELRFAYYTKYNNDKALMGKTPQKKMDLQDIHQLTPFISCDITSTPLVKSRNHLKPLALLEEVDEENEDDYAVCIESATNIIEENQICNITSTINFRNDNVNGKEMKNVILSHSSKNVDTKSIKNKSNIVEKFTNEDQVNQTSFILKEISLNKNNAPPTLPSTRANKKNAFTVFCD